MDGRKSERIVAPLMIESPPSETCRVNKPRDLYYASQDKVSPRS